MTIFSLVLAVVVIAGLVAFHRRGRRNSGATVRGGQIGRSRREAQMENQARKWRMNG
jgi:hypothetical protein